MLWVRLAAPPVIDLAQPYNRFLNKVVVHHVFSVENIAFDSFAFFHCDLDLFRYKTDY